MHYSRIAREVCKLPREAQHFAWLGLDSEEGQEYWMSMNLAGDYARACHEQIHLNLSKVLGLKPMANVNNHHNFAWKEMYDGEELIVHRKGATPAGKGKLGVVPGSMGSPGFIVRGKGNAKSFNSCSHGAGRVMSRAAAFRTLKHADMKKILKEQGISLIGGTLDESPEVYKDINKVIDGQRDLVDVLAKFEPKLVRMAAEGNQWGNKKKKKKPENKGDEDVCM